MNNKAGVRMDKIEKLAKMIKEAKEGKEKIEHHQQLIGINSRITILKKNTSFSPVINRIPAVIDM